MIDLTRFVDNLQNYIISLGDNPVTAMVRLFFDGGWIIFVIVFLWGMWGTYMLYIQSRYKASVRFILLAIDVPKENLQSTKAIENVFAHMWTFYESINMKEKYIDGRFQQAISLEIVSIGGYTQFLIRAPATHRDLVEAAFYSQYPKAEITEVEDYASRYRHLEFPSDEYDMVGTEYKLERPSAYPIRTYPQFEHTLTQQFADPMASLLEVFNSIKKGEELWMQLVITPIKDDWKEEGHKIINKIIGAKQEKKKGIMDIFLSPLNYLGTFVQEMFIYGIGYEPGKVGEADRSQQNQPPNKMLYLTPEEKNMIEGITIKMRKLGWQAKLRSIYIGKKGKLNKARGLAAFIGALQQFSSLDLNKIVLAKKIFTKVNYFFVQRRLAGRQNRLMMNFRSRSQNGGWGQGFVLNIEELATIFHFPIPEATREGVKTVEAKKEAAPSNLPDTEYEEEQVVRRIEGETKENEESVRAEPPGNLPI